MAIEIPVVWRVSIETSPTATVDIGEVITSVSDLFSYSRRTIDIKPVTTDVSKKYPMSYELRNMSLELKGYSTNVNLLNTPNEVTLYFESNGIVDPSTGTYLNKGFKVKGYVVENAININEEFTRNIAISVNSAVEYTRNGAVVTEVRALPGSGIAPPALPTPF